MGTIPSFFYYSGLGNFTQRSANYGNDQPGGGNSGEPYIVTPIPPVFQQRSQSDSIWLSDNGLIRGGFAGATKASVQDTIRIGKFLKDPPRGPLFIAKQIGLQLSNHPNIKIIHQENGGPAKARNNGIKNSNGVYILPLDSDDMISTEYIQSCVNVIRKDKNISPVYCDTNHIGQMSGVENRPEWSKERLIQGPFIVNCSMFSRESFDQTE